MTTACTHKWEPAEVFHAPGRICVCGRFEQVSAKAFKSQFGRTFKWYLAQHAAQKEVSK